VHAKERKELLRLHLDALDDLVGKSAVDSGTSPGGSGGICGDSQNLMGLVVLLDFRWYDRYRQPKAIFQHITVNSMPRANCSSTHARVHTPAKEQFDFLDGLGWELAGEYSNTAASGGRLYNHPLRLITRKEVAHDLLMIVVVDLEERTGQGREAMTRDGVRRLILIKALFAGCGTRADKGYPRALKQRLDLSILAKRSVYRRKDEVTALQLGYELFWRERPGKALDLKIKICWRVGVELGFGEAIGMPLLVKIDWHNAQCWGCEVIEQGAVRN